MKKLFERWAHHHDGQIRQEIDVWLQKRSAAFQKDEDNVHPILLADLLTRIVQEDPILASKVLDIVFADMSQLQWHRKRDINPNIVLTHVSNLCEAQEDWSAMPMILESVNQHVHNQCHLALGSIALQIMRSPQDFRNGSEHFTIQTKRMMLPYCLAADPYNTDFISQEWGVEVNPVEIWRAIMVHTKNLSDLKDLEHLVPLSDKIGLADIMEFVATAEEIGREFNALSLGLKNITDGHETPFNISSWSYAIKDNPERVCLMWLKLLDFPQNCISFNNKVALQHISKFATAYDVSFESVGSKIDQQILNDVVCNSGIVPRVRKI